jgi:hypothetical protein
MRRKARTSITDLAAVTAARSGSERPVVARAIVGWNESPSATICAWRRRLRAHGEAGLAPGEPHRNIASRTCPVRNPDERRAALETYGRSGMTIDTASAALPTVGRFANPGDQRDLRWSG